MSEVNAPTAPIVAKYDDGKAPLYEGVIRYFSRALEAVARVSEAGSAKYSWSNYGDGWAKVPNGFVRYTDGMLRHVAAENYEDYDLETQTLHAANAAWNSLARLEMLLRQKAAVTPDFFANLDRLRKRYAAMQKTLDNAGHPGNGMLPVQFRREPLGDNYRPSEEAGYDRGRDVFSELKPRC